MNWSSTVRPLRRKSLLGQLVVLALGVQLLFFGSFTALNLPTATGRNLELYAVSAVQQLLPTLPPTWTSYIEEQFPGIGEPVAAVRFSPYVPLAPLAVAVGYVIGVPLGFCATAIFVLSGIIGPFFGLLPFAAGGGLDYYSQPSFGYLIGLIFSGWLAGRVTQTGCTSMRQLACVGGGLFLTHAIGLLYLFGSSLALLLIEGEAAYLQRQPWLFEQARNLSWYALPYDVLFGLALVGIGFPFRWLVDVVTAPDIITRSKPRWDGRLEQQNGQQHLPNISGVS